MLQACAGAPAQIGDAMKRFLPLLPWLPVVGTLCGCAQQHTAPAAASVQPPSRVFLIHIALPLPQEEHRGIQYYPIEMALGDLDRYDYVLEESAQKIGRLVPSGSIPAARPFLAAHARPDPDSSISTWDATRLVLWMLEDPVGTRVPLGSAHGQHAMLVSRVVYLGEIRLCGDMPCLRGPLQPALVGHIVDASAADVGPPAADGQPQEYVWRLTDWRED